MYKRQHLRTANDGSGEIDALIAGFVDRISAGESLAIDQLLNAVHLLTGGGAPAGEDEREVMDLVLRELSRA